MSMIWDGWIWVALAVPILYGLDAVLDAFFVGKSVYRNPVHATILSGLFSGLLIFFLLAQNQQFERPPLLIVLACLLNGAIYLFHVYFYFKALFKLNDSSNIEVFLGFSVFLVPVLAFIFLNEKLILNQYLGITIALIGVIILTIASINRKSFTLTLLPLGGAILLLSISFVIQDEIYQHVSFHTGLTYFMVGQVIAALLLWLGTECNGVVSSAKRFGPLFIFSQFLGILAVVFSQRAIDVSPSISYVAAIETTTPLFIMLFSLLLFPFLSGNSNRRNPDSAVFILRQQLAKMPTKIVAFVFLLVGIIFITIPESVSLTFN